MDRINPKKHLGQHFLKDENIARKIISAIPDSVENILEVGPGPGVLTKYLLENKDLNSIFVEVDTEAAEFLVKKYPVIAARLINEDFLKTKLTGIFPEKFSIIGNFPYNISSQIFFRVLEHKNQIEYVIGMVQKEVAERIASPKGSKKYGILSVLLQAYFDIEFLFTVNEQVFFPPPRVKSAVIRLKRNSLKKLSCEDEMFFKVVKKAFNQRRKQLRNSLKEFQPDTFTKLEPYLTLRPEQLDVEDFITIATILQN